MAIEVSKDCYRCGDCINACPVPGTITNILPGIVRVNPTTCIECRQCLPVCRFKYISYVKTEEQLPEEVPNIVDMLAQLPQVEKKVPQKRKRKSKKSAG